DIMEKLCDKSVYPVYLHCSVGTDRTGTFMFLLGLLLKIDLETLFLDYEFSSLSQNFYHWAGRGRDNFERNVIPVIMRYGDEGDDIYTCTEKYFDKALGMPGLADKLGEIFFEDIPTAVGGSTTIKNVEYGEFERQKFDLCLPENPKYPNGLILFIHGGAWIAGGKGDYEYEMPSWAAKGFVCAALNYHFVSETVHMDTLMNDVDLALKKIKETAAGYGFSLEKCLLTGTSAGAHMSLLYAYKHGKTSAIRPVAVVSNCGPVDLTNKMFTFGNRMGDSDYMKKLMGNVCGAEVDPADLEKTREALLEYSPIRFTDGAVPTVIAHGMKDTIVPYLDAEELDCKLSALGVPHDFVIYPNSDHDLWADRDCRRRTDRLFAEYAEKYLS
ncbi:MAG: alpha/beta hydrolase, partial [Clostridia bacterium]|nr:alpha/beta hydrolase [Clostridia bacterium]